MPARDQAAQSDLGALGLLVLLELVLFVVPSDPSRACILFVFSRWKQVFDEHFHQHSLICLSWSMQPETVAVDLLSYVELYARLSHGFQNIVIGCDRFDKIVISVTNMVRCFAYF